MKIKSVIVTMLFCVVQVVSAANDTNDSTILDVRTEDEFSESHLKDAINIDFLSSDFKSKIEKLDRNKSYKVYCRSGNRSGKAEKLMKEIGFKNVENIGSKEQAAKKLNKTCEGKSC